MLKGETMETVKVSVSYRVSQACQKELTRRGLPNGEEQVIILDAPLTALDKLTVEKDGTYRIFLHEQHYEVGWRPEEPATSLTSNWGTTCSCCNTRVSGDDRLNTPINSWVDVEALFVADADRLAKVDALGKAKFELREKVEQAVAKATEKLTTEYNQKYDNALSKLAQIKVLIQGKSRVRVNQISDILS